MNEELIRTRIAQLQQEIGQLEQQLPYSSNPVTDIAVSNVNMSSHMYQYNLSCFQALLDTVALAIIVTDNQGNILVANQRTLDIFGYSLDQLTKSSVNDLLPEQLRAGHGKHLDIFFKNPRPRPMGQGLELIAQRADETLFPIEASLSVIQSQTGIQIVAFIADISTRVNAEQKIIKAEQERIDAIKQFITNVAHDFKTPMASIMTRLYILEKATGGEHQSHTDALAQQVKRLNNLVDTMLAITRLETIGQLEMEMLDLNKLLETTIELVHPTIYAKKQELRFHQAHIPQIMAHHANLLLAIKNILMNATIFTPAGGAITVTTSCDETHATVEISDTGIGIDKEDLPFIFEHLFRSDRARTMNDALNGLGLAIVKHIIDLHHGRIEVESELDQGSTFRVILPLE